MKSKHNFKALFWPTLIELMFFMLMGTIDTLMLSNYSDFAVGSVGNSNSLLQMFAVLLLVVANGVAVLVSQYIGAKKLDVAKRVIGNGIIINILVGFILSATLIISAGFFLNLVNTDQVLFDDSKTYLRIIAMSLFFVAISNVITASLRSFGYAKYITFVVIAANILNVIGNYLLINGYHGFPRLGVYGASLSTLGVRFLMMIVYFILLFKVLKISIKQIKLHKETANQIIKIGLPSALESWTYTIMQAIVLSMINQLGPIYTTSRTYISTILTYIYIFSLAFAAANAVMTGYYIGEKNYEKAYKETLKTALRSVLVVVSITLLVNIFSYNIISIFTKNQTIIETVRRILWLAVLLEFSRSFNLILIQALRSAGDTKFPLIMAILIMLGVAVPMSYLLGIRLEIGLFGIYIAYVMDEMIRALFMYFRWQSRRWEAKSSYIENTI